MYYKLIADGGGTSIAWALTDANGVELKRFRTDGINALLASEEEIHDSIRSVNMEIPTDADSVEIHYYGAGCVTPELCSKMEKYIGTLRNAGPVSAYTDLLGAARSLLGTGHGIACILGTGSNSCLYDGEKIAHNVPSLGFILGDEGSGAALGKRLVGDACKGLLPTTVCEKFLERFKLTVPEILNKVYCSPKPNKFLGSLVPFLADNLWNPYVYSLVLTEFRSFLRRNVGAYEGSRTLPICFTGSIAFHFSEVLRKAAAMEEFTVGTISADPLDGLIKYHATK